MNADGDMDVNVKECGAGMWQSVRDVWEIVGRLRGEGGCPWDRKQTPETLQTYLIEEAHEAAAAVRAGDVREVAEELGDLLFMVFFLTYLYEEKGDFTLDEVARHIHEKMIRRHPHVFGDATVESAQDVIANWEKIKAGEKASAGKAAGEIPTSLPALVRAYRILSRLSRKGEGGAWDEGEARVASLAIRSLDLSRLMAEGPQVPRGVFGDLLLEVVNLARLQGHRAEDCLHEALGRLESDTP